MPLQKTDPRRQKKFRYTPEQMVEAIRLKHGLLTNVAIHLGCSLNTVINYCNRFPEVAEACKQARHRIVDIAESALFTKIKAGDITAIIFTLKCLGKSRDYIDRSTIEHIVDTRVAGRPIAEVRAEIREKLTKLTADGRN
jgi:hypothetical protein